MNPNELLRIVDSLHREKNIEPEIVFQAIEAALATAAKRQYGEESDITVSIDRPTGTITAYCNGELLDPEEVIGRIGAQTAKQVIIQKIREAERDSLIEEFQGQLGHLINGVVQRYEHNATTVSLGNIEAILPRSEQIPGESHHPNERLRAVICDVRPQGSRVRVVLSRTRPLLVQRLFEQEIPEIADGVIEVRAIAREPGYRSKVAVSSTDQRVDCVGACVGVRGNRIKNIVDELANERIDIVRWNDDAKELITNALQPAEVDQVLLCDMIGRAIVLVREDQLSLAIGRKGQNVRLASKLCGWDIEIMTEDELEQQIERAVTGFGEIEGITDELAQSLVEQGYLSYDDLSVIEPDDLMEMGGLTEEQAERITEQAETKAEQAELAAAEERRRHRDEERRARQEQAEAAEAAAEAPVEESPVEASPVEEAPLDSESAESEGGASGAGDESAEPGIAGEPISAEQAAGAAEDSAIANDVVVSEPDGRSPAEVAPGEVTSQQPLSNESNAEEVTEESVGPAKAEDEVPEEEQDRGSAEAVESPDSEVRPTGGP